MKIRQSVIHKRDIRKRCRFCDAGVSKASVYHIEALDTLPAPAEAEYGTGLCTYCFTGRRQTKKGHPPKK
jgi:hypothetical protein